jgi:putative two-component system hydrogenase maturation factor HypX/HoxX
LVGRSGSAPIPSENLLPKVGQTRALELTQACQPIGTRAARNIGFLDEVLGEDARSFEVETRDRAKLLAANPEFRALLRKKHERRIDDESVKPLASYRAEELERMKVNFFGADPSYHEARRRFAFKGCPPPKAALVPIRKQETNIGSFRIPPVGAALRMN